MVLLIFMANWDSSYMLVVSFTFFQLDDIFKACENAMISKMTMIVFFLIDFPIVI